MKFQELHDLIPYAKGGKEKILRMEPYPSIILGLPGRHADETSPKGGDFVVMVSDRNMGWRLHQFKHDDIFMDLEQKSTKSEDAARKLVRYYGAVVLGASPLEFDGSLEALITTGINPYNFLRATQCLAVAEHRRYAKFEQKFGGRYLPLRFAAGIVEQRWTAAEAISLQRKGRPGVEMLEKANGKPAVTRKLMEK